MTLELSKVLKRKATTWAGKLTSTIKAKAPKHIAPHITSKSKSMGDGFEIVVSVKPIEKVSETGAISNYGTMDAKAQEYGHPGAVITPRAGRKFLSFPWEVQVVGAPRLPNGNILLKKVNKKPQPAFNNGEGYFRPAVREWRTTLKGTETAEIANAIKIDLRKSFDTSGKAKWVLSK